MGRYIFIILVIASGLAGYYYNAQPFNNTSSLSNINTNLVQNVIIDNSLISPEGMTFEVIDIELKDDDSEIADTLFLDDRIFLKLDSDDLSSYDDDDSSFTTQEYEDAINSRLIKLKTELNESRALYANGELDQTQMATQVRQIIKRFASDKQMISDKRIDQTHKVALKQILKLRPDLIDHFQ